jgi:predicted GNAT family N-acyltransferase
MTAKSNTNNIRLYELKDQEACLSLMDGNSPLYFAPFERKYFVSFLVDSKTSYFVMENAKKEIIACGGYDADNKDPSVAVLCWGMVRKDLHHLGLGQQLLLYRLQRIKQEQTFSTVMMETSQHSCGFYERFGFTVKQVVSNGFASNLDLVKMELDLSNFEA